MTTGEARETACRTIDLGTPTKVSAPSPKAPHCLTLPREAPTGSSGRSQKILPPRTRRGAVVFRRLAVGVALGAYSRRRSGGKRQG